MTSNIWLPAHSDPLANIHSFQSCMILADAYGDSQYVCLFGDHDNLDGGNKLKVYSGTNMVFESQIHGIPTAMVGVYVDQTEPRIPAVAVASGPYIYVYKNTRPYFKFTVPPLPINQVEEDIWREAREGKINIDMAVKMLENLRNEAESLPLAPMSLRFLQIPSGDRPEFLATYKNNPLKRQTVITCLDSIKKEHAEEDEVSCIIIGTESMEIYVLDPEAFTVLVKYSVPSAPVFIRSSGLFDVDFRFLVACRNGEVLVYRKGSMEPKFTLTLTSHPVGVERVGKYVVLATMDKKITCYSSHMKSMWTIHTPFEITTLALMDYKTKTFKGFLVGLANKEIRVYHDKFLIDSMQLDDVPIMISFGKYGREDSNMIVVTENGSFNVFILKRSVDLSQGKLSSKVGPSAQQSQKLNVPKKTKTYVDQTLRERESGIQIHRQFSHDIYRMRLTTARAYVAALKLNLTPISNEDDIPLKLNANVQGLGPRFQLSIEVMNTSNVYPIMGSYILFVTNETLYHLDRSYVVLPLLAPSLTYSVKVMVKCQLEHGVTDTINAFVYLKGRNAPALSANIEMPVSEPELMD